MSVKLTIVVNFNNILWETIAFLQSATITKDLNPRPASCVCPTRPHLKSQII